MNIRRPCLFFFLLYLSAMAKAPTRRFALRTPQHLPGYQQYPTSSKYAQHPLIISFVTPSKHPDLTLTAAAGMPSFESDWCISRAPHLLQKKPFVSPLLFGREYVASAPGNGEGIVKEGQVAVMP